MRLHKSVKSKVEKDKLHKSVVSHILRATIFAV